METPPSPSPRPGTPGLDVFKIAGRSISGFVHSFKTGDPRRVRQPCTSRLEGYWWRIQKLIHLRSFLGQSHESSLPCFGTWLLSQPGIHAAQIERGGGEHVLE